jgi:hypothetical protein
LETHLQPAGGLLTLLVVNAQHLKAVPGCKTDVNDAEWIADLLRHGLLRPSFIPTRPERELRELTRYRTSLIRERGAEENRVQKVLEGANIKLASVASDVLGVSGRAMLEARESGMYQKGPFLRCSSSLAPGADVPIEPSDITLIFGELSEVVTAIKRMRQPRCTTRARPTTPAPMPAMTNSWADGRLLVCHVEPEKYTE